LLLFYIFFRANRYYLLLIAVGRAFPWVISLHV
jgi:hypothetical protein